MMAKLPTAKQPMMEELMRLEKKDTDYKKLGWIVLEIVMFLAAFAFLFPVFLTLINSFKSDAEIALNPLAMPKHFGLDNYVQAWKEINFPVVIGNTFVITALSTIGIILVSSMAAYILVRTRSKLSWALYFLFVFNMVVPFQTVMIPLNVTATKLNLKNVLGIIPIYIGLGCPLAVFMYHGFIKTIPVQIEESAAIDGASVVTVFFRLVFPLLGPIHATIAILDVLWIWNDFLLPLIILPSRSTLQLAQHIFFGMYRKEMALAMASLVLSASPIVLFYLALQKYIIKGVAAGAIKG